MKKLIFVILLVCFARSAYAQQSSVVYMPLTSSAQFLNRVTFTIALSAPIIQVESASYTPVTGDNHPSTTACHSLRALLASQVSKSPAVYSQIFAINVVTNVNITSVGITGSGLTLDSAATDAALFSAINAIWSNVAGCITTP